MPIFTGTADANGGFTVPFPSSYTSGQKVTVTAEKDSATKTIELYAPSDTTGGGVIKFSGTLNAFPQNIGVVTISGISGAISNYALQGSSQASNIFNCATGLVIQNGVTSIGTSAFDNWPNATSLILPATVTNILNNAFLNWSKLISFTIPANVTNMSTQAFRGLTACLEIVVLAVNPPTITSSTFTGLNASCIIKVPAASVAAYQAAANWSAFASKIVGI